MALGRVTIDPVKSLDGEFERSLLFCLAVEGENDAIREDGAKLLDRSFSEGGFTADDDRATVILECRLPRCGKISDRARHASRWTARQGLCE